MKLAVSGKGGVGKTTISAGLTKLFAEKGIRVFAVDADPDVSLGTVLGFDNSSIDDLKPIVDMREVIMKKTGGSGAYFTLNPNVDDILEEYVVQNDNIFFLKMGAVKQGGSSCYCRENTVLNSLIKSILLRDDEFVILDMGAGIEHLTRGTAGGVDLMIVVTEPTRVSVQTAKTVSKLSNEIGIYNVKFIGNKIRNEKEKNFLRDHFSKGELLGFIPFSEDVIESALEDGLGFTIPQALEEIANKLIKGNI